MIFPSRGKRARERADSEGSTLDDPKGDANDEEDLSAACRCRAGRDPDHRAGCELCGKCRKKRCGNFTKNVLLTITI